MLATIGFKPTKVKNENKKIKAEKEASLIVEKKYTHSCAVGQTGCGKTTSYIYPNLNERISHNDGILFLDYKGKEHNAVKLLAKKHNRLKDVIEIGKPWGKSINVIKYMSNSNLEDFILGVLGLENTANDYWSISGTTLAMAILNVVGELEKFMKIIRKHPMSNTILNYCFNSHILNDDMVVLKNIPTTKNLAAVYDVTSSIESMKKFALAVKKLPDQIKIGLNRFMYNAEQDTSKDDIEKKYKFILENFCILENIIEKYLPSIDAYSTANDKSSTTLTTILLAVNKPLSMYGTKDFLNNDSFDVIKALNNGGIVVINTQEMSEEILSSYCLSIFTELQKRISMSTENSIAVFIDEAQRVVSRKFDLPIDILREAKVELFLSYQNDELMIEKLGKNKYTSLYKNFANRYLFKNNEKYLSGLNEFEYFKLEKTKKLKPKKSIPLFLEKDELFDVELEYQKELSLYNKFNVNKNKYKNMIFLSNSALLESSKIILKEKTGELHIVLIANEIDKVQFAELLDSIYNRSLMPEIL